MRAGTHGEIVHQPSAKQTKHGGKHHTLHHTFHHARQQPRTVTKPARMHTSTTCSKQLHVAPLRNLGRQKATNIRMKMCHACTASHDTDPTTTHNTQPSLNLLHAVSFVTVIRGRVPAAPHTQASCWPHCQVQCPATTDAVPFRHTPSTASISRA